MKQLAEKYHAGQFRKGEGNVPYIVHPKAVAETLIRWGAENDSAAVQIAWGHDLLEDTTVSENEILDVSSERILQGILLLTRPRSMDKALYLQKVAASGDLEALLVKISDRICNSKDFVQLKGAAFAHQYLHEADCLIAALEKFSDNSITQKAWQEWNDLDEILRREAQGNAGALK